MRKIGLVSEYFYPHLGGVTEHVYHYALELVKRGFEVVILTGYRGTTPSVPLPQGLKVLHLGWSMPIFSNESFGKVTVGFNLKKKVKEVLAREKFDLIHIHSPVMPVLPLLFQQYTDTVTIGTFHTYFDSIIYYKIFKKYAQAFLDALDGIIAVSPSCIEAMEKYFHAEYTVIPNGVDTSFFSNPTGKIAKYDDGSPTILFLGRLDPRNGLDNLLEAFPHVLQAIPQARLLILGDGPLRAVYENKVKNLIGKNIFFEGLISNERPEYFATSQVFCYPATKASFGITLLESMAAGTPLVATDNKGFRDLIQNGVNGLLVPPENPHALAGALLRVLQDQTLARRLSQNGREMVKKYSWSQVTDQILAYYNQVFMQKRGIPFAA